MVVDLLTPPGSPVVVTVDELADPAPTAPVMPAEVAPAAAAVPALKRARVVPPAKAKGPIRDPPPRVPRASTMLLAIKTGNKGLFDELLRQNFVVNQQTTQSGEILTPLIAAIKARRMVMVEDLISAGADEHFPQRGVYSAFTVARSLSTPQNDIFSELTRYIKNRDTGKSGVDSLLTASLKVDADGASGAAKVVGDGGSAASPDTKVDLPEGWRVKRGCIFTQTPGNAADDDEDNTGSLDVPTGNTTEDDDENAAGGSGSQAGPAPTSTKAKRLHLTRDGFVSDPDGEFIADDREPRLIKKHEGGFKRRRPTSPMWDDAE